MTTTLSSPSALLTMTGADLGHSDWLEIPQRDIDLFAQATHDRQWIHVDVKRAEAGPFGTTIAHGYLTLSLLIPLWARMLDFNSISMGVNYGLNKVRFPAPVPSGSRVRLQATIHQVTDLGDGGVQAVIDATMYRTGAEKPVCAAQMVHRYYE
jgi:acyl dehydratase